MDYKNNPWQPNVDFLDFNAEHWQKFKPANMSLLEMMIWEMNPEEVIKQRREQLERQDGGMWKNPRYQLPTENNWFTPFWPGGRTPQEHVTPMFNREELLERLKRKKYNI